MTDSHKPAAGRTPDSRAGAGSPSGGAASSTNTQDRPEGAQRPCVRLNGDEAALVALRIAARELSNPSESWCDWGMWPNFDEQSWSMIVDGLTDAANTLYEQLAVAERHHDIDTVYILGQAS